VILLLETSVTWSNSRLRYSLVKPKAKRVRVCMPACVWLLLLYRLDKTSGVGALAQYSVSHSNGLYIPRRVYTLSVLYWISRAQCCRVILYGPPILAAWQYCVYTCIHIAPLSVGVMSVYFASVSCCVYIHARPAAFVCSLNVAICSYPDKWRRSI